MIVSVLFVAVLFFPQKILAVCDPYEPGSEPTFSPPFADWCRTLPDGSSEGTAYYSCGNYCADPYVGASPCNRYEYGCYFQYYTCTGPCGSAGNNPPGGGGGGGFICPLEPVKCPAGSVRGSTLLGSQCLSYQCTGNVGSAQQVGSCCDFYTPPRDCGPWYDCPTPSNPNKQCRDCTQEPGWCQKYNYETYNCVSVCSATAPTNVTFTPISITAAHWAAVERWGCAG